MPTKTKTPPSPPPAQPMSLRAWLQEQIEGRSVVSIRDLTNEAMDVIQSNPELLRQYLEDRVRSVVYREVQQVVAETRTVYGDYAPTVEAHSRKIITYTARFRGWLERANGEHVEVFHMTRPQLIFAAKEREAAGTYEIVLARAFYALAAKLPNDTTTVGDVLNDDDVEAIYKASEDRGVTL